MRRLLCWLLHDWSSWSAPIDEAHTVTYQPASVMRQSCVRVNRVQGRSCFRCGRIQERVIRRLAEYPAGYVEREASA